MQRPIYHLDEKRRSLVLSSLREACFRRDWVLLAAHVRTSHVHAVVHATVPPEKILPAFKAYASRHLNRTGWDPPQVKRWTRHGSTVYLWSTVRVHSAIRYVIEGQGPKMTVFEERINR